MAVDPPKKPDSLRSLAASVGRSLSAVRKWKKHPKWIFGDGPYDVAEVQKWMGRVLKRDPAQRFHDAQRGIGPQPLSDLEKARTERYQAAARITDLKRRKLEETVHDVGECRARRIRQLTAFRNALTRSLPRALATELIGRSRGDMEQLIRLRLSAVCDTLAKDIDEQSPPTT
jgi:hypothetical protein